MTLETNLRLHETSLWSSIDKFLDALDGGRPLEEDTSAEWVPNPSGTCHPLARLNAIPPLCRAGKMHITIDGEPEPADSPAGPEGRAKPGTAAAAGANSGSGNLGATLLSFFPRLAAQAGRKLVGSVASRVVKLQLQLSVELRSLEGTLRLWIPPPPSDRLW